MSLSLWPKITDKESAVKTSRQGLWVYGFSIVITSICIILYLMGKPVMGIGPMALIDIAIFVGVSIGLYKMSRTAAIIGLVVYILERLVMLPHANGFALIMTIIFTVMVINSVRGTIAYHKFNLIEEVKADMVSE